MLNELPERSQMEKMCMFLDTGGKTILVIKWQRIWLNCVLEICGRWALEMKDLVFSRGGFKVKSQWHAMGSPYCL